MGVYGDILGSSIGALAVRYFGGNDYWKTTGKTIGGYFGKNILPFKKGGKVHSTGLAYLHKNEIVLPVKIKPTKSQLKRIKKGGGYA